jgi:hypothetical protein
VLQLFVPRVGRSHWTYGAATPSQLTSDNISGLSYGALGDLRLIANWQGLLTTHNLGLQLGVKVPTGRYGGPNAAGDGTVGHHPYSFTTGPAADEILDTSLQPGTGSTDLIAGAYYYQAVSQNFDAFANAQFQSAMIESLDQPGADFRPGNQETLSFGLRYEKYPTWTPQLQVNVNHKSLDQGALADTLDSPGTVVYLSPGLSVSLLRRLQAYGFVQVPLWSYLVGYQLFPRWTATVGLSLPLF